MNICVFRCLCLAIFFAVCLTSCNKTKETKGNFPDLATINIIDRNGFSETISNKDRIAQYKNIDFNSSQPYQKVLRVFKRDDLGDIRAYITSYHPNGFLKQYLEVVNNRAYGTYQEWHENGQLKLETFVVGGDADINTAAEQSWLFDGWSRVWNEKGSLMAEFKYSNGIQEGLSIYYHPNGKIWKRIPFENNNIHGTYEIYLSDGELLQRSEYFSNQRHGQTIRYWPGLKISTNEFYDHGLLMSGQYFDLCGNALACVENGNGMRAVFGKDTLGELQQYCNGVLEGEIRQYGFNGELVKLYHIKGGIKSGEEIDYFESSTKKVQPKLSISWYNGKIHGPVKTWYSNGVQESQRDMSNNKKNGLATAWYLDSSIMLIEEYDNDKLMRGEYFQRGENPPITMVINGKGIATIYDENGAFVRRVNYQNGKPSIN